MRGRNDVEVTPSSSSDVTQLRIHIAFSTGSREDRLGIGRLHLTDLKDALAGLLI